MASTACWAAPTSTSPLAPWTITRRAVGARDIAIEVHYCGVCHSDLHQARDEWDGSIFPMVPGHEVVGRVTAVGAEVTKVKVGDAAGVGCMVDSCRKCAACHQGLEQYCPEPFVATYNSREYGSGTPTYGGYSKAIVVDEHFVLRLPENLDMAAAAPLLCAGITTYSPLRHWNAGPGKNVGVVGLGGLGHMAVKIAAAMGAEVTVFTTSDKKRASALALGATHVVVTSDAAAVKAVHGKFHLIIDTVSAVHDLHLHLLRLDGTVVLVGVPEKPLEFKSSRLIGQRRSIAGSNIGGIAETQEMLDFCGKHNIVANIELIPIQKINEAYERMLASDVQYRFVIDIKNTL